MKQSKNTVLWIKFDVWSLKRKVKIFSRLKKKTSFCFSQLTYLFSRFLPAATCYFNPWLDKRFCWHTKENLTKHISKYYSNFLRVHQGRNLHLWHMYVHIMRQLLHIGGHYLENLEKSLNNWNLLLHFKWYFEKIGFRKSYSHHLMSVESN